MAIANALAVLLYILCSTILIRNFLKRDHNAVRLHLPVDILAFLALIFHAAHLLFIAHRTGGWDLSLLGTLALASWLMALLALLGGLRWPTAHIGIIVYPLVALTLIVQSSGNTKISTNPALEWHILLSLAAYSLLTLAAIHAVILAIQERQLRRRQFSKFTRQLPPLQSMETALFQLIIIGFILLTLGLLTGLFFVDNFMAQHLAHKTVLSIIAWLVFGALIWGRYQFGWRSQTAVRWTLTGFILLLLAYVGSKFVLEYILKVGS